MLAPEIIEPPKSVFKYYLVEKYDILCEPHFRIKKIVGLRKPKEKFILDIFLNIITVGLINYLYGFFPLLVKVLSILLEVFLSPSLSFLPDHPTSCQ